MATDKDTTQSPESEQEPIDREALLEGNAGEGRVGFDNPDAQDGAAGAPGQFRAGQRFGGAGQGQFGTGQGAFGGAGQGRFGAGAQGRFGAGQRFGGAGHGQFGTGQGFGAGAAGNTGQGYGGGQGAAAGGAGNAALRRAYYMGMLAMQQRMGLGASAQNAGPGAAGMQQGAQAFGAAGAAPGMGRFGNQGSSGVEPGTSQQEFVKNYYSRMIQSRTGDEYYEGSEFWNWGLWSPETVTQTQACENLMETLIGFIPNKSGTILDVACGKGATSKHLLRYYNPESVSGINIAEDQLAICRETAPGVRFQLMDAARMSFEDASFDNIICVEAACHFDTREAYLRDAYRILKPGGRLVFSDPLLQRYMPGQPRENYLENADQYREKCKKAGFLKMHIEDATRQCWGGFSEHFANYLRGKVESGEIPSRQFSAAMQWLQDQAPHAYIIGWCEKP